MGQQDERDVLALRVVGCSRFQLFREIEYFPVLVIVHADDHVYVVMVGVQDLFRFGRRGHPHELRRIAQVKFYVFLVYLRLYLPVFFEDECIIIAAYHQDFPHSVAHEGTIVGHDKFFKAYRFYCVHIWKCWNSGVRPASCHGQTPLLCLFQCIEGSFVVRLGRDFRYKFFVDDFSLFVHDDYGSGSQSFERTFRHGETVSLIEMAAPEH